MAHFFDKLKSKLQYFYNRWYFLKYQDQPIAEVFEDIYRKNSWRSSVSKSGPGSELEQTKVIIEALSTILRTYQINSLLDLPCGDWNWLRSVDLQGVDYVGADIVPQVIEKNRKLYTESGIGFLPLDLVHDDLPTFDLVLCRDCLVHFSYKDIARSLQNIVVSGSDYLLTTTFPEKENLDITTGNWRPVNLQAAPFNLPKPLELINEQCTEGGGVYRDKSLALWEVKSLQKVIGLIFSTLA